MIDMDNPAGKNWTQYAPAGQRRRLGSMRMSNRGNVRFGGAPYAD
jgi:hypothetical protein